jgi:hypothetical protein
MPPCTVCSSQSWLRVVRQHLQRRCPIVWTLLIYTVLSLDYMISMVVSHADIDKIMWPERRGGWDVYIRQYYTHEHSCRMDVNMWGCWPHFHTNLLTQYPCTVDAKWIEMSPHRSITGSWKLLKENTVYHIDKNPVGIIMKLKRILLRKRTYSCGRVQKKESLHW